MACNRSALRPWSFLCLLLLQLFIGESSGVGSGRRLLQVGHAGGGSAGHGSGHHHAHHLHQPLPTCQRLLSRLADTQISALRDVLQMQALHLRRRNHWGQLVDAKKQPKADAKQAAAYATNHTLEQLEQLHKEESSAYDTLQNKINSMVQGWRDMRALPHDTPAGDILACAYARTNPHLFEGRPRVSLMLQFYKRPEIIQPLVQTVQACAAEIAAATAKAPSGAGAAAGSQAAGGGASTVAAGQGASAGGAPSSAGRHGHGHSHGHSHGPLALELLVNVDSPEDAAAWAAAAGSSQGLVVPVVSANVHEVRAYNRLAHLARGDILVLLADDDMPQPGSCTWLTDIVKLMDAWPGVGVVGLRNFQLCWSNLEHSTGLAFKDPTNGLAVQWVQRVDMAPLAVRRRALLVVGGFDETLAAAGECGILSDWELCHRMWLAGWQVMAAERLPVVHVGEEGGTHKGAAATRCWEKQQNLARGVMYSHMTQELENEMCEVAKGLNLKHLQLQEGKACPYGAAGCSKPAGAEGGSAGHGGHG